MFAEDDFFYEKKPWWKNNRWVIFFAALFIVCILIFLYKLPRPDPVYESQVKPEDCSGNRL